MTIEVAKTILAQLGGGRFQAMTGANTFVGGNDCLSFKLPNARFDDKRVTHFRITLMPSDTYKLEALTIRKQEVKTLETSDDVYVENLRPAFTRMTGLYTSLAS